MGQTVSNQDLNAREFFQLCADWGIARDRNGKGDHVMMKAPNGQLFPTRSAGLVPHQAIKQAADALGIPRAVFMAGPKAAVQRQVTAQRRRIVGALAAHGGTFKDPKGGAVSRLAEEFGIDLGGLSGVVATMIKAGMVTKVGDRTHSRELSLVMGHPAVVMMLPKAAGELPPALGPVLDEPAESAAPAPAAERVPDPQGEPEPVDPEAVIPEGVTADAVAEAILTRMLQVIERNDERTWKGRIEDVEHRLANVTAYAEAEHRKAEAATYQLERTKESLSSARATIESLRAQNEHKPGMRPLSADDARLIAPLLSTNGRR